MAKEKELDYILVRNLKQRNFNGVNPYQIVEILSENLTIYLDAGFEVFDPTQPLTIPGEDEDVDFDDLDNSLDEMDLRKDFLAKHGFILNDWRKGKIIKESDKLGFGLQANNAVTESEIDGIEDPIEESADPTEAVLEEATETATETIDDIDNIDNIEDEAEATESVA